MTQSLKVKAVVITRTGGPDVLAVRDIDVPAPGAGEVRIRVRAFGLNRADALYRAGRYIETPEPPCGLGLEAAGTVEAVGAGVTDLAPGDAVAVIPPVSVRRQPLHAEAVVVPAARVVKTPAGMGFDAAAALWMAYLTAWGAMVAIGGVKAGDVVAITAASSSVGIAAIQVARRVGAIPVAVTRTIAKAARLRDLGAAHVVVSEDADVAQALAGFAPDGVRVVLDPVGGPGLSALTAAMGRDGVLVVYGGLDAQATPLPVGDVLAKRLSVRGFLVHQVVEDAARLAAAKAFILDGVARGELTPVIAARFGLSEIAGAHRYLEGNAQVGKVVVTV